MNRVQVAIEGRDSEDAARALVETRGLVAQMQSRRSVTGSSKAALVIISSITVSARAAAALTLNWSKQWLNGSDISNAVIGHEQGRHLKIQGASIDELAAFFE